MIGAWNIISKLNRVYPLKEVDIFGNGVANMYFVEI